MGTISRVLACGKHNPAEIVVEAASAQKASAPHSRSRGAAGLGTPEYDFGRLAGMVGRLTEGDRELLLKTAEEMANR